MRGFKSFVTLGLACLAAWASPIPSESDNRKSIADQAWTPLSERAVPGAVVVEPWEGLGTGTQTHPTFIAKMSTGIVGAPSHADVGEYARKAFENMMTQRPREKDTHLVAALYIPTTRSVYISSVPDGPGIGRIKDKGATDAPAWWSQVQTRNPMQLHAEDGAAYLYESSLGTKLAAGATYPAGSFVAVYGIVNKAAKDRVGLCAGGGDRPLNPYCSTVFGHLNVEF